MLTSCLKGLRFNLLVQIDREKIASTRVVLFVWFGLVLEPYLAMLRVYDLLSTEELLSEVVFFWQGHMQLLSEVVFGGPCAMPGIKPR